MSKARSCSWGQNTFRCISNHHSLLQDKEVEGLQFQKDNQWCRVPIIPEALFINVGDQVEIMSNGIFKSPVHRVVTNSERERMSLAVFYIPEPEKEIGPDDRLVNES
ncbi:flavonol synthase/flavanone 3-hydroxylase-like [Carya illinoinensis]|uniref:flavonol synthase/flavanone 3-hydroxylase-like n=1 Tax=Carya illinoinensis TaxID=32201 RepID=UPI001C728253|nr:flavonol synthase/flavanone 3-hydroxylase-like [Carya illinoinensis]